ncbi:MAG: hypothetical protein Q8K60_08690 [Parachlamydiaceae bacterium]|nr:hypothetical protein [Parachlamydiaceae bacterium]
MLGNIIDLNAPKIIETISFYNTPELCKNAYKKLSCLKKILSCIQSYGTLFLYALNRIYVKISTNKNWADPYSIKNLTFQKNKLVVCLHGLNNSPIQFKKIINELEQVKDKDIEICAPEILQNGNAKLDDMVKPIFKMIKSWAATPGEKELILVGISNGARIERGVEAKIRNSKNENLNQINRIRFISIVGANQGSSLAKWADDHYLGWVMSKNIRNEMPEGSDRNIDLNDKMSLGYGGDYRPNTKYFFIASPHDWQVPNTSSTLMDGFPETIDTNYAIVQGHGHNSIVNAVSNTVVSIITEKYLQNNEQ